MPKGEKYIVVEAEKKQSNIGRIITKVRNSKDNNKKLKKIIPGDIFLIDC